MSSSGTPAQYFKALLSQRTFSPLHLISKPFKDHLRVNEQIFVRFLEKIVELVHLLVSGQLQRIEKRENITHFLSLFYKLTFDQVDWDGYLSCLETWQCFVAHLKRLMESSQSETLVSSYSSSLIPLSETLLQKIFFMNNGTKLEELDDLKEEDVSLVSYFGHKITESFYFLNRWKVNFIKWSN